MGVFRLGDIFLSAFAMEMLLELSTVRPMRFGVPFPCAHLPNNSFSPYSLLLHLQADQPSILLEGSLTLLFSFFHYMAGMGFLERSLRRHAMLSDSHLVVGSGN